MLVCSVSLRVRRAVVADLAEAAAALDIVNTPGLGQLVSEAAAAATIVDATLIAVAAVVEASSAADASLGVLAGGIAATVAEVVAATAAQDGTTTPAIVGTVAEAATAGSAQDATTVAGGMPWAFDLFQQGRWLTVVAPPTSFAVSEATSAADAPDAAIVPAMAKSAVLEGAFVDPQAPSTLLGTEVIDSGPVTVFKH